MRFPPKHLTVFLLLLPAALGAQQAASRQGDSTAQIQQSQIQQPQIPPPHYWRNFSLGFITSILSHEAGHIITAYAIGGHPTIGLNKGRPTIYSGIDASIDPHKQFLFSSAGLNVQAIQDELLIDIPHHARGNSFERGMLAGGFATAFFYATLGRNANVSDITFMARTSSLSKTEASLIYVGLASIQMFRISRDHHYANFFMIPKQKTATSKGGVAVGVAILPE